MRNLRVGVMLIVGVLWAGAVWADDDEDFAPVPQTGQTIPYDSAEKPVNLICHRRY